MCTNGNYFQKTAFNLEYYFVTKWIKIIVFAPY